MVLGGGWGGGDLIRITEDEALRWMIECQLDVCGICRNIRNMGEYTECAEYTLDGGYTAHAQCEAYVRMDACM